MLKVCLAALCTLLLLACGEPALQQLEGYAQGTTYHITYWSERPTDNATIQRQVLDTLTAIDKDLSNYRSDSNIEHFNAQTSTDSQAVSRDFAALVRVAQRVSQASAGCYDLTIKPLFDLWGFNGDHLTIPTDAAIAAALENVGMDKLEVVDETHLRKLKAQLAIDISSIAQGYSVEKISEVLERNGVQNYLVEIGGELKTKGRKPDKQPWRIAVERPLPGAQTLYKIITSPVDRPLAIMTSGTYRHYYDANGKRYSHILDARNGRPVTHDLVSVTVLHHNPIVADAWSTALLCLGQTEGLKAADANGIAALFIQQQGDRLPESRSQALTQLKNISIQ